MAARQRPFGAPAFPNRADGTLQGLQPGEVEVVAEGSGLRVEPLVGDGFVEQDGRLVIPASGVTLDDAAVRILRDADQP